MEWGVLGQFQSSPGVICQGAHGRKDQLPRDVRDHQPCRLHKVSLQIYDILRRGELCSPASCKNGGAPPPSKFPWGEAPMTTQPCRLHNVSLRIYDIFRRGELCSPASNGNTVHKKKVRTWQKRYVRTFYMLFAPHIPRGVILSGGIAGVELLGATRVRGADKSARRQPTRDLETSLAGLPPLGYILLCRQKCK